MSVREKRLKNDHQNLLELVNNSGGTLAIISTSGTPPNKYIIEYRCKGIEKLANNQPVYRLTHQVEILLGNNYPNETPSAKFVTPIFHPNVYSDMKICLGNKWTMAEHLSELVIRIGKIIQYATDITNLNSPANGTAKNWSQQNMKLFPLDRQTFKIGIAWQELPVNINFRDF